jgi:hypothetical protein
MGFRRRRYEYEAGLYKVPTPWLCRRELGELERTSYEDGEERLKISFRSVDAPDGASAEVVIDGATVAQLPVQGGRGRRVLSSSEGAQVPDVKVGQEVEIRVHGKAVLAGVFKPD